MATTQELIGLDFSIECKHKIDGLLGEAYKYILELRQRSLNATLSIEYIDKAEQLFLRNQVKIESSVTDKYLSRYIQCISNFWACTSYFNKQVSRGKFDLFKALKEKDLIIKGYSDLECALVLRKMENYWVASNQIYTMYSINLMKRNYIR